MIKYTQKIYGYFLTLSLLSLLSKLLVLAFRFNYIWSLVLLAVVTFSFIRIQSSRDSESPLAFLVKFRHQ